MVEIFHNGGVSTLAEDLDASETGVDVVDGSVFPTTGNFRIIIDAEIMLCTARSTNTLTVIRGSEGSTASIHGQDAEVSCVLTKGSLVALLEQNAGLANEVMNFPSLELADNTQPEWWEVAANCTLTEVDIAGESITESYERGHKVVTTASSYAYQRYTYADQPRIKSGMHLSAKFAVWSVSSAVARIRLQSSVGSLAVSSDTTAAAWTILTLDGITLDGTYVDIRCEVDSATAYFIPLGISVSEYGLSLPPRGLKFCWADPVELVSLTGTGDPAVWTDVDCTSNTSNITAMVQALVHVSDTGAGDAWDAHIRRNGSSQGISNNNYIVTKRAGNFGELGRIAIVVDDSQIFEYYIYRWAGSGTIDSGNISLNGYWEWA